MMDVTLTQLENSTEIFAEANTGNKQWVAVITDTHPKYNYEREFVAYQKPKTSDRDSGRAELSEGDVVEKVRYTHSGKNDTRCYYQFAGGELHEIDETEITSALEEIIVEVEPETHECDECGDEFDSEHGLAVHAGIVHSEDEADDEPMADADDDDAPVAIADGGETEIRDAREVRHTDAEVRHYRADGMLYAYREDGEHVVVSRGDEPATRWTKRVPAERTRVLPGEQLWTVPDNWEHRVRSSRDSVAYGIYYIPESDTHVKLSIPTNNWLTDAWYGVKAVGDITASAVGDLASAADVYRLADECEDEYDAPAAADTAGALREVARNWDAVENDLAHTLEWVQTEGVLQQQPGDQPVRTDEQWVLEFHEDRVFRAGEVLSREADLSEYEIPMSALLEELRSVGLPSYYKFKLGIDTDAVGMEYEIRALTEAGCTPPEALDYYMVERVGLSQSAWADERGIEQPSVSGNVSDAKRILKA